jgi:ubiquinone/menaquinone biosynthesis C-methylase UbiE
MLCIINLTVILGGIPMDILIKKLNMLSGKRILDVATGRGSFIKLLQEGLHDYEEIIGIDNLETSILEKVSENFTDKRIKFMHMDACSIEFASESFDIVCLSNSLHHLKDIQTVLSEMTRVLKPGGILIVNEMICDNQIPAQMTYVLMHHWWAKIDVAQGKLHNETFPKQRILEIVDGLRLNDIEVLEFNDPDDPMDKESIESISNIIDEYIERAKPLNDFEVFKQEGETIRKHLFDFGVNGATQIIILGKK